MVTASVLNHQWQHIMKYDQTLEVCKPMTEGSQQVEEGTNASRKDVRTVGKLTGKAPDMQNVWDITETVMEERVVEEIPLNIWEQVS